MRGAGALQAPWSIGTVGPPIRTSAWAGARRCTIWHVWNMDRRTMVRGMCVVVHATLLTWVRIAYKCMLGNLAIRHVRQWAIWWLLVF